jgi:hypothetical protein
VDVEVLTDLQDNVVILVLVEPVVHEIEQKNEVQDFLEIHTQWNKSNSQKSFWYSLSGSPFAGR